MASRGHDDDLRGELLAGLSAAGRRQYEGFAVVYQARQVASRLAKWPADDGDSVQVRAGETARRRSR